MDEFIKKNEIKSPDGNDLTEIKKFNQLFETEIGAVEWGQIESLFKRRDGSREYLPISNKFWIPHAGLGYRLVLAKLVKVLEK